MSYYELQYSQRLFSVSVSVSVSISDSFPLFGESEERDDTNATVINSVRENIIGIQPTKSYYWKIMKIFSSINDNNLLH